MHGLSQLARNFVKKTPGNSPQVCIDLLICTNPKGSGPRRKLNSLASRPQDMGLTCRRITRHRDNRGRVMTDTIDTHHTQQTQRNQATRSPLIVTTPTAIAVPTRRISFSKRLFDLSVAVPAAIVTLPVTATLAAITSIRYRQSPLFTQPRLGHGGQEFKFWKIRSLPRFAPDTADKYQLQALDLPKFSQVIRTRHLDELPQLWLVISGKMSLIGPRPEMPTLSASFDQDFVAKRLSVRPGCTGLWQVSRGSRGLIGESPEWDLHYVENATLRLDLWISYRTVLMMTKLQEVESLSNIPRWTGAAPRSAR